MACALRVTAWMDLRPFGKLRATWIVGWRQGGFKTRPYEGGAGEGEGRRTEALLCRFEVLACTGRTGLWQGWNAVTLACTRSPLDRPCFLCYLHATIQ